MPSRFVPDRPGTGVRPPIDPRDTTATAGRLFLAVPLSDDTRTRLDAYLKMVGRGRRLPGRVVRPDNWHLTLRFLGETKPTVHDQLVAALEAADLGPAFELTFNGLGAFPDPLRARVLWVGVEGGRRSLAALAEVVERTCVHAGWPPDPRSFRAHLTLSRFKSPTDVTRLVSVSPATDLADRVCQVVLYRSHLGSGPPHYEVLQTFPLAKGAERV